MQIAVDGAPRVHPSSNTIVAEIQIGNPSSIRVNRPLASNRSTIYSRVVKIKALMRTSSERIAGQNGEYGGKAAKFALILWPRLVELWILTVIAFFFLIRVLGSHTWQRLLSGMGRQHLP